MLCEAIGAAAALHATAATAAEADVYARDIAHCWGYAERYLIERPGAWRHELNPDNTPGSTTWEGKPDIYHALQACLLPGMPLRPALAWALKERA